MEAGDVDFGPYGFGSQRSVEDYERFAGLSFRLRLAHEYTVRDYPPPNPEVYGTDEEWLDKCVKEYWTRIRVPQSLLAGTQDCDFWFVGVHDHAGIEIVRKDLWADALAQLEASCPGPVVDFAFHYRSVQPASSWTVWPHHPQQGWLQKLGAPVGQIGAPQDH